MAKLEFIPVNRTVIWIIHAAFIVIVPAYAVMFAIAIAPGASENPRSMDIVSYMPVILAFITIPVGFFLPFVVDRMGGARAKGSLSRLLFKIILSDAVFESVAIYGMIGVLFLGTPMLVSYGLMGVSFVLLVGNSLRIVQEP